MYLMVLMVHNWYKAILNQLCTIGTNKYMYHKGKNHTAIDSPKNPFSFIDKQYFYHSLDVSGEKQRQSLLWYMYLLVPMVHNWFKIVLYQLHNKNHFLMVLMVHDWYKTFLNQLCTISTIKYIDGDTGGHKWFKLRCCLWYISGTMM
jgi:hypothetical protein